MGLKRLNISWRHRGKGSAFVLFVFFRAAFCVYKPQGSKQAGKQWKRAQTPIIKRASNHGKEQRKQCKQATVGQKDRQRNAKGKRASKQALHTQVPTKSQGSKAREDKPVQQPSKPATPPYLSCVSLLYQRAPCRQEEASCRLGPCHPNPRFC